MISVIPGHYGRIVESISLWKAPSPGRGKGRRPSELNAYSGNTAI